MTFWEGFFTLPMIFIEIYLGISLIALILVLVELSNRKLKIDKTGVTFDRLREKKPLIIRLLEIKHKKKTSIEEIARNRK